MVGRFKGFTKEAEPCLVFLDSLALCVMDVSDSAFYIHELGLQLAGLVVVIYATDDLDSGFFHMNRLLKSVGTHSISILQRAGI